MIDTLYAFDQAGDFIIKIDSSNINYFYGTYISKYLNGKNAKISPLRFTKNTDTDSIIGSSLLFCKELLFNTNGKLAREKIYKINGKTSDVIDEKIFDENLK